MKQTACKDAANALFGEVILESSKYNQTYQNDVNSLFSEIGYKYSNRIKSYQKTVRYLFNELVPKIENYKKERENDNLLKSCDFNTFDILKYDENVFSNIIADMLNPEGTHGQKEAFLLAFLQLIEKKNNAIVAKKIKDKSISFIRKIQREESTEEGRRMDIYAEFKDRFVLVIENKIGAKDQPKQVEDYIKEIENRNCSDFLFIYLNSGNDPDMGSLGEKKREELKKKGCFVTASYKEDIVELIEDCIKNCRSEKYIYFLKDMKDTILNW